MSGFPEEHVVIVTGASVGIGRELALQLAEQGAWLTLAARDVDALQNVAEDCRKRGGKVLVVPTDVTDRRQVENMVAETVKTYGRINTLINNAGISMWTLFEDLEDLDIFEEIMRVNYLGSVYCTHYALPYLKKTSGRLVAVSSLAGKTGVPTRSGYGASKHAMVGFFDSLRIELAEDGVSVTILYPDFVSTEIRKRAFAGDGQPLGKDPVSVENAMKPEECARLMIPALATRKRELVMSLRGRVGQWIKLIAPGLVDKIARNAIDKRR